MARRVRWGLSGLPLDGHSGTFRGGEHGLHVDPLSACHYLCCLAEASLLVPWFSALQIRITWKLVEASPAYLWGGPRRACVLKLLK